MMVIVAAMEGDLLPVMTIIQCWSALGLAGGFFIVAATGNVNRHHRC